MKYKLGFVGTGVMAGAIIERIIGAKDALNLDLASIVAYDLDESKLNKFVSLGISKGASAYEVLENAEIVMLGVKPQFYADILTTATTINAKTILSIMAGVKIATLRKYLGENVGIVRIMPNTPCVVGKGVMALTFDNCDSEVERFVLSILETCGRTLIIDESKFDAVTSISGSGPAYVYAFADAMVQAGIKGGLTKEESKLLTLATLEGSATYAGIAEFELDTLVERVCSKGGTTIEAITIFKDKGLAEIVGEGIDACREKSKLLSEKL
ncbi:MAG: pyrroline-5-carboxylate reductase [Clostridia bacterium]|nr:pyrroline-5-carboxylate reductase [Clostridia bacterium]